MGKWVLQHWFDLMETIGVVGGLCFTYTSLRSDTKTRQIANLLTITANHREIWKDFLENPKLARVRNPAADISKQPITDDERVFVTMVIQHLNSVYYAISDQLMIKYGGLRQDIEEFLSLPIPRSVWGEIKQFQNDDFVKFVENAIK
jgi:hypothetical protein